ncbi:MAG: hypothetical protein EKK63_02575 [Acinetobacter sp.]|uniref:hypothetical protein n=1 Tax=Acinetobacter sp. TaxID=472 RepID=UPI000F93961D|nr:hypothetical protein [Acinetobacter sp.]RUP42202.1 MAG: hypothetical protein EKK63_02575 [Acinetobacter sp.]
MKIHHNLPEVNIDITAPVDSKFEKVLQDGLTGLNQGFDVGGSISKMIDGIQKSSYYLIGAHPNIGKTQFTDFFFVLKAWLKAKSVGKPLKIFYWSLEISSSMKKAKWASFYLQMKYGLHWKAKFILGRIPDKLPTKEEFEKIQEALQFVSYLLQDVIIIDQSMPGHRLYKFIADNYYAKLGTIKRDTQTEQQKKFNIPGHVISFIPNQDIPLTLLVADHIGLIPGSTTKNALDAMSKDSVDARNMFGISPVLIQQFNQDLMSSRRESLTRGVKDDPRRVPQLLAPQQLDFGDSTYTFRDADLVLALVQPSKFQLQTFDEVPIGPVELGGIGPHFRAVYLLKNRDGFTDRYQHQFMDGLTGMFYDLPDTLDPDYSPWIHFAKTLKSYG